jgi:molybdopterin converting factor small subunit
VRIVVRYLGQAATAAGRNVEEVQAPPGADARDLLVRLAAERGEALRGLLLAADGGLRPSMLFFVGDEQLPPGRPWPLRDGDTLTVLAPMAGG